MPGLKYNLKHIKTKYHSPSGYINEMENDFLVISDGGGRKWDMRIIKGMLVERDQYSCHDIDLQPKNSRRIKEVAEILSIKINNYFDSKSWHQNQKVGRVLSNIYSVVKFPLYSTAIHNLYYLNLALEYIYVIKRNHLPEYLEARKLIDIDELFSIACEILKKMLPDCSYSRYKKYSKILASRIHIGKSLHYPEINYEL